MLTNCVARAKLVLNKKLNTYKVVIAFNAHKTIVNGEEKYNFPTQAKCNYVSGDITAESLQKDLAVVLSNAQKTLRTNNIVFVD